MNINKINICLILLLTFSCAPERTSEVIIPETILSKKQLITILVDSYLAEGASGINVKTVVGKQIDSVYLFNPFKDNNCTKGKFDTSMTFYTNNPILLKEIYNEVLEQINSIEVKGTL